MEFEGGNAEEQLSEAELLGQVQTLMYRLLEAFKLLSVRAQQRALQLAVMVCLQALLLWVSVFLYGTFYYTYMPRASYSTPVHFYYSADCQLSAVCSFPMANVSLLSKDRDHVMTYGQPYRISLELEMPESPANQNLGMFMVKMTAYGKGEKTISTAARSTMLHYHSALLQMMATVLLSPLLLSGASEQKQLVTIELFSDYTENSYVPTAGAVIELQSHQVQVYSSHLFIHAHFTGIRYVLFNFPVLSAVVGVASVFIFLSIVILIGSVQHSWNIQISQSGVNKHTNTNTHTHTHTGAGTHRHVPKLLFAYTFTNITFNHVSMCMFFFFCFYTEEANYHTTPPTLPQSNDPPVEACNVMEESIPEGAGDAEQKPVMGESVLEGAEVSEPKPALQPDQEGQAEAVCAEAEDKQQMAGRNKTELEGSSGIPKVLAPSEEQQTMRCIIS
ncbi:hypothetical protein ACEWY4_015531 [Coilia grayii]|uniref:Seipin n=1 Tax=Coilia grayii TaxID=363190 RepID=A0ABD1JNG3_9TELE